MVRRIHPRHTVDVLSLRRYSEDPSSWVGTFEAAVELRAQVVYRREVVSDGDGVRVVTLLTARVPPRPDGTVPAVNPGSEVTHDGDVAWVLTAAPVTRHGRPVYLELTAGESPPRSAGGVGVVEAVLHRTGGWDRDGTRLPTEDVVVPVSTLVPGETSEDAGDRGQHTSTTADWFVPLSLTVASTDRVTIPGPSYVAGAYQVDGDPSPSGDRLRVPLRRS